jgi:hypothetical protein
MRSWPKRAGSPCKTAATYVPAFQAAVAEVLAKKTARALAMPGKA